MAYSMKKFFGIAVIVLATGHAAVLDATPMAKVVKLLRNMQTKIQKTGKAEQKSYDKYACWCEDTLSQKADDISKAKDKLEALGNNIVKNKGNLGAGGATIAQLTKDIAENKESTKEATGVRGKENDEYSEERAASEKSISSLEGAIGVLTGAGEGKKGFLQTLHEAQLLSVVASMRPVLQAPTIRHKVSGQDLEVVRQFVEQPEDFLHKRGVFAQVGQNPFGDYAPASSRIQGIFKSMYDSFTSDLEKDNVDEAEKQKGYEELMATKKKELETLTSSLQSESKDFAEETKQLADDKAMRDDTTEQLESDTDFFKESKESCTLKAKIWAERTRLRTMEMDGITQAINIMTSKSAKKTFKGADSKFLQLSSSVSHHDGVKRMKAYNHMRSMATRFHSLALAQIAIAVKSRGHFDSVIKMINEMMAVLRAEGLEDIAHRDRCEGKENSNKNAKSEANKAKANAKANIKRLNQNMRDKTQEIAELKKMMRNSKSSMSDITMNRKMDNKAYKKAHQDDVNAIDLLNKAKKSLEKFYKDTSALQIESADAAEPKGAPRTKFKDANYKGSTGEARGVLSIIEMIVEDLRKEIKTSAQDEADDVEAFEKQYKALTRSFNAQEKSKAASTGEFASLKSDKNEEREKKAAAEDDLKNERKMKRAIAGDCDWVKTQFGKRARARKAEMAGLEEARDFLAGAGTDSDLEMPEF